MKPHIKRLNSEIEAERRGKVFLSKVIAIFAICFFMFNLLLLAAIESDWIDKIFKMWQVQLAFITVNLFIASFLYLRWKIRKEW